jgi:hypothetical protein
MKKIYNVSVPKKQNQLITFETSKKKKKKKKKEKLQKTIASIWFNKTCKSEQLQPKYIHIKVNGKMYIVGV